MKQYAVDKNNAQNKLPWTAAWREPYEWVRFESENVNGGMLEFDQACFIGGYFLMECKLARNWRYYLQRTEQNFVI